MKSVLTVASLLPLYENKAKELEDFIEKDSKEFIKEVETYNDKALKEKEDFMKKWNTIDKEALKESLISNCCETVERSYTVIGWLFDHKKYYKELFPNQKA